MTDWTLFWCGLICCLNVINMIWTKVSSFIQLIQVLCLLKSQYPLLFNFFYSYIMISDTCIMHQCVRMFPTARHCILFLSLFFLCNTFSCSVCSDVNFFSASLESCVGEKKKISICWSICPTSSKIRETTHLPGWKISGLLLPFCWSVAWCWVWCCWSTRAMELSQKRPRVTSFVLCKDWVAMYVVKKCQWIRYSSQFFHVWVI